MDLKKLSQKAQIIQDSSENSSDGNRLNSGIERFINKSDVVFGKKANSIDWDEESRVWEDINPKIISEANDVLDKMVKEYNEISKNYHLPSYWEIEKKTFIKVYQLKRLWQEDPSYNPTDICEIYMYPNGFSYGYFNKSKYFNSRVKSLDALKISCEKIIKDLKRDIEKGDYVSISSQSKYKESLVISEDEDLGDFDNLGTSLNSLEDPENFDKYVSVAQEYQKKIHDYAHKHDIYDVEISVEVLDGDILYIQGLGDALSSYQIWYNRDGRVVVQGEKFLGDYLGGYNGIEGPTNIKEFKEALELYFNREVKQNN